MSAKIYSPPTEVGPSPEFERFMGSDENGAGSFDSKGYFAAVEEFEGRVREWARENGQGDLAGEVIRFPVADGKASYVVFTHNPLALIDVGDDYRIDAIMARGLRVTDVRSMVKRDRALAELFAKDREGVTK